MVAPSASSRLLCRNADPHHRRWRDLHRRQSAARPPCDELYRNAQVDGRHGLRLFYFPLAADGCRNGDKAGEGPWLEKSMMPSTLPLGGGREKGPSRWDGGNCATMWRRSPRSSAIWSGATTCVFSTISWRWFSRRQSINLGWHHIPDHPRHLHRPRRQRDPTINTVERAITARGKSEGPPIPRDWKGDGD